MQEVDRYALAALRGGRAARCVARLRAYDFPAIFQRVNQFTTVDLCAFYADVSKDRLYTFARGLAGAALGADGDVRDGGRARPAAGADPAGDRRRAVAAPSRHSARTSVHLARFPRGTSTRVRDPALEADWQRLSDIRDEVNRALEAARQAKTIGTSLRRRE